VNALLLAAGPTATTTAVPTSVDQGPDGTANNNGGAGAGSWGLLIILGLIVVSIALFYAMNRSLRSARRNLGGDQLPRRRPGSRPRHVIPLREDDVPPPAGEAH
jgi:hypothetical protein